MACKPGAAPRGSAMSWQQQRRICAAVLQKVLMCAAVDTEAAIRQLIFAKLLPGHIDEQLAQPEASLSPTLAQPETSLSPPPG